MDNDLALLDDGMADLDDFTEDCTATGTGIVRCLRMLAEEAAGLRMPRTLDALRQAMATCAAEAPAQDDLFTTFAELALQPGARLH